MIKYYYLFYFPEYLLQFTNLSFMKTVLFKMFLKYFSTVSLVI